VTIRDAAPEDWAAIWPFFRAIVAAGETYAYPLELDEADGRALWMEAPPGRTVVAVGADGAVAGSAKMGANRAGHGGHVATASFMVDPARAGRGIGRALAEEALAWARSRGFAAMQFNAVVAANAPAVHLWQALGFTIVGTVPDAFDHPAEGLVGLHVMHRYL
jgi:GNAT superfamily N-acetyltransferase